MTASPPRYVPDRALPAYAFLPGRSPHPINHPDGHSYGHEPRDVVPLSPTRWRDNIEYLWGVDLYNTGYHWEAHEAWEGVWRLAARGSVEHSFLQGLIQCAAALVKDRTDHVAGIKSLSTSALRLLDSVRERAGSPSFGLDLAAFTDDFGAYAKARVKPRIFRLLGNPQWPLITLGDAPSG